MKKILCFCAIFMALSAGLCTSCDKESDSIIDNPPSGGVTEGDDPTDVAVVGVTTGDVKKIGWNGGEVHFVVTPDAGAKSIEAGIRLWQEGDEENAVNYVPEYNIAYVKGKANEASVTFRYLKPQTSYCYCAWAVMDGEEYKGETKTFTTTELQLEVSQAVDLGLSVKWAAYNVGASSPEELGSYFSWGETAPKEEYTHYSYDPVGKNLWGIYKKEGKTRLEPEDDAATVNWGAGFRMPTCAEKHELLLNTERYYTTYKGVAGCLFESKVNGKYIFFPYTGAMVGTGVQGNDEMVGVWTCDLYTEGEMDNEAYMMCNIIANGGILRTAGFEMDGKSASYNLHSYRYMGYSVRAVSK